MSKLLFYSSIAAVIGVITFQLGVFDRPEFHYYENLWWPDGLRKQRAHKEDVAAPPLYVVMVATNTNNIGGNVERLAVGVKEPLDANEEARKAMAKAAQEYGAPEGADALSVGLYFEEPGSVESARWALGYALSVSSVEELEKYKDVVASSFQLDSTKKEQVRAIRVGPGPVLKARIPWRTMLTPAIAPMFHWKRGFQKFYDGEEAGKYNASNGRNKPSDASAVSCEIYVTGKDDSMEYIDYAVLMGDTSVVWDDTFPSVNDSHQEQKKEVPLEDSVDKLKVA